MIRKQLYFIACLLFGVVFMPKDVEATHMMGVDATYECINNCTIRVHLRAYRDCTGASSITNTINFNPQTPGCGQPTAVSNWSSQITTEVTPICQSVATGCTTPGAAINGVQEYYWWRDYDICSQPNCIFTISWGSCCRNGAITSGQSNQGMGINATTVNTGITPCNGSPYFNTPPVPYICQGQPYVFNQGATDPEGDSLAYSLGPCYTNATTQVSYAGGYSATQPLGSSWNVSINAVTGDITVFPQPGNNVVGVMCVYVEEWRNGSLINTIVRDIQMTVIPCPNNTLPSSAGVANVTGGSATAAWNVTVCAGTPMSLQIPNVDPDAGQTQTVYWNSNIPGATFSGGGQTDTLTGNSPTPTFTWTPGTTGQFTFLFTVHDDACPILGQNQYTIIINVQGGLPGASVSATPTGCTNVALSANPGTGNTGPYVYSWFGDGNLNVNQNNTNQNLNHTYPGPGSYEVNVQITDAFGCVSILTDTVIIPTGPIADGGPDISMCSGYSVSLGAPTSSLPANQTYLWAPGTGLSSTTVSYPTFSHTVTGSTPDTLNFTVSSTSGFCTSVDYVTVVVYPTPVATISGNANICMGQSTTLTANGGTSYLWSTNDVSQSITVSPTQTTTYSVTAINNGCSSPAAQFTVIVSQGPNSIITGVDSVCAGDNAILTVAGGSSWLWSNGSTTQTITISNIQQDTTLSVVASDNGCPGPASNFTITVHEKPVADFAAAEVCVGAITQFNDQSFISLGGVIAWRWDFNDPLSGINNASASQNPMHDFTNPGTYNVELIVTSYNGCMDTVQHQIIVNPLPTPDFSYEDVCDGDVMIFNDGSSANSGIVSHFWDFGTGVTSTLQNPTYSFPAPGPYNVNLTVTDGNGCVNSTEKTVFVHPNPVSNFTFTLHCFNTEVRFTSTASLTDPYGTTIDAHYWDFGDPSSGTDNNSTMHNPIHVWTSGAGTYNVSLTTTTSQGCTNTIIVPVTVAAFNPLRALHDTICRGTRARLSVASQAPNTTVEWFYTPNGVNPFHVGPSFYDTPPLEATTVYYVGMRDADGCLSPLTGVKATVIPEPWIDFHVNSQLLDIPNAIAEFTVDQVHNGPISGYTWDFGDGTTSGEENPVHEYTEEGFFDISVTVVDEYGCMSTHDINEYIEVVKTINIFVPNIFTPNRDELNDEFFVVTKLITDFHIDIYDRWGKVIFVSDDMNFRWGGTLAGQPLPEGVYTYVINAVEYGGEKIRKAGSVTLTR